MIAACIVLPLLLFLHQGYTTYAATSANADLEIARTRDIAREHAAKVLETIERSLSEINELVRGKSDADIRANEAAFHERLSAIDSALPQMKSNWVIGADGIPLVNSIAVPVPQESFADRDYFASHRDADIGIYLGHVLIPKRPFGRLPFFSMSRRRSVEDGRFAGIIQASILPDYFEKFYQHIGFEPGSVIMLALADGSILASYPAFPLGTRIAPDGHVGAQLARSPDIGLATLRFGIDGVERRVAYERLASYPVYVAAGLSTDAIFARWMHEFGSFLMIAAPGAALLVVMLYLFLLATQRIYAESASRARAEAALRESQRIEALGQLTGGVAHDFNNFLTVIGASADMLRRGNLSAERRLRYLDAITDTVARATNLTGQLLAFARRQPLKADVFDAGRRILSMTDVLQTLLGTTVDLRIQVASAQCLVEADASQFETALINLAANARDAMQNGGTLVIALDRVAALPSRLGGHALPDGYLTISVTDTGAGIPADQIERVFEPFFTTKTLGHGTGLGLPQVYGFAKQSRGEVTVDSAPGEGATFTLFLPRVIGKPLAPSRPESPPAASANGVRVLLVDDNEMLLRTTEDALLARGFCVLTSRSAEEASARLGSADGKVDVVLTDVVMPGGSGLELAAEIRRRWPGLPVVVTTGYSETIEREGAGDLILIRKPYDIDGLAARLTAIVAARADSAARALRDHAPPV